MKINQIIHEAGTGLEIDRSIPGRTIARISGDVAYRTGSPTGKKLPDYHPDDDYTPWSGKVGASIHDDEEDTFDVDYMGDDGELKEFVSPQATAQDPGLEREKDVDVVFFGQMPRDFTADTVAEALEAVLPREYPPGSSDTTNSNVYRVVTEIAKHQGAVVTTKPLSIAQKLVKTFQTYGIKCRIDAPGLEEGVAEGEDIDARIANLKDAIRFETPRSVPGEDHREQYARHAEKIAGYKAELKKLVAQKKQGVDEGTAGLPDPNDFASDNDYYDALDAYGKTQDTDSDYENMIDEPDDCFDESREKVGNMDADAFDDALARLKKLAGAGPLRTVYDPNKRVYKNVPHAVQPAQQPKKAK